MKKIIVLYLLVTLQSAQAFNLNALNVIGSMAAGMTAYLPVALPFIVPRAKERNHAAGDRDNAEAHHSAELGVLQRIAGDITENYLRMNGTFCARDKLAQFTQDFNRTCQNTLAQNGLSFIYEASSTSSYTTRQSEVAECHNVPHTSCSYRPYHRCTTHYTTSCTYRYYDRIHETVHDKDGFFAQGNTQVNTNCHYFSQGVALTAQEYIASTSRPIWIKEYEKTVNDWSSKLVFDYQMDTASFQRTFLVDKTLQSATLEAQAENFIIQNCQNAAQILANRSIGFYVNAWGVLNDTVAELEQEKSAQEIVVQNSLGILNEKTASFNSADDRYSAQLKIHLPILFLGGGAAGFLTLFTVQRIMK